MEKDHNPNQGIVSSDGYPVTENESEYWAGRWRKPKRVFGIQASPRKKHGATEMIYGPFAEGIKSAGAVVTTVHIADLVIKPCAGCFRCWTNDDGRCIIHDDMDRFVSDIPSADLIVFATPLYVDGVPGLLKNFIDRLMPLNHPAIITRDGLCLHPSRLQRLPNMVVVAVCGFYEKEHFKPLTQYLAAMARNMHMPLVGKILRPETLSLRNPLAFSRCGEVFEAARAAGKELIQKGSISKKNLDVIVNPLLSLDQYMEAAAKWWIR